MASVGKMMTLDLLGVSGDVNADTLRTTLEALVASDALAGVALAPGTSVSTASSAADDDADAGCSASALLAPRGHVVMHFFKRTSHVTVDVLSAAAKLEASAVEAQVRKTLACTRVCDFALERNELQRHPDQFSTPGMQKYYVIERTLASCRTKHGQHAEIHALAEFGRALFIDGELQVSESDEHLYSKKYVGMMNAKRAACVAKDAPPPTIGVIGCGDGGLLRELVKHPYRRIELMELDEEIVDMCREHLPSVSDGAFDKVENFFGDAFVTIKTRPAAGYDMLYLDLTDDDFVIQLACDNMDNIKRVLADNAIIGVQLGSADAQPKDSEKWLDVFRKFGFKEIDVDNTYVPSFGCRWHFAVAKA